MGMPKELERYSYRDFLSWPEGERWELIDGVKSIENSVDTATVSPSSIENSSEKPNSEPVIPDDTTTLDPSINRLADTSDGVAYAMAPAAYRRHQGIVVELVRQFANYLLDDPCRVYPAPFDVKFSLDADDEAPTVLEPDVVICCDPEKLTREGITGAPDLAIDLTLLFQAG